MRCPIHGCEMQIEHDPNAMLSTQGRWYCQKCRDKAEHRKKVNEQATKAGDKPSK